VDKILDDIIRREGGFVDHPDDKGGPTKFGITQKTLSIHLGHPATRDDVLNLSEMQARMIYDDMYIQKPGFDRIRCEQLRGLLVDCAVNHGPHRAVCWLQQVAAVHVDGIIGPHTTSVVNGINAGTLYLRIVATRARFYGEIITSKPSQAVFASGWMNRLSEFIDGVA